MLYFISVGLWQLRLKKLFRKQSKYYVQYKFIEKSRQATEDWVSSQSQAAMCNAVKHVMYTVYRN